eukprot:4873037-Amphidinium_carterae.1
MSADYLREVIGDDVKWSQTFPKQEANLLGHCLRRPEDFPEHASLKWKHYCGETKFRTTTMRTFYASDFWG